MTFLKLCSNDPLLSILKDTFKANPITVPEERIKPLIVFAKSKNQIKFIGEFNNLLQANAKIALNSSQSQMANLSGTKSKKIEGKLGLQVLDGFLKGFGSDGASIDFAFEGVTELSFSFQNVAREYIDVGDFCRQLMKNKLDAKHPIVQRFIDEQAECIIVDSIITSNNFSINIEKTSKKDFSFNLPEIEKVLTSKENEIKVSSSSKLEISFNGKKQLAFAFTGLLVKIDSDGSIYYEGEPDRMFLTKDPRDKGVNQTPAHFLADESGLFEIDFE